MFISEGHMTWCRMKKQRYSMYDNILKQENHLNIKLKMERSRITKPLSRNEIDVFPKAKNSAKNNGKLKRGNPMQKRDFCKRVAVEINLPQ